MSTPGQLVAVQLTHIAYAKCTNLSWIQPGSKQVNKYKSRRSEVVTRGLSLRKGPGSYYKLHRVNGRPWRSGSWYLNKGECDLNQSNDDSFVERVAKNNSWNNNDCHKIHEIFLINCFVFVITLVWQAVHSSAMTQIKAHLMEKTLQLTVPR